jgi:hypothetical protein
MSDSLSSYPASNRHMTSVVEASRSCHRGDGVNTVETDHPDESQERSAHPCYWRSHSHLPVNTGGGWTQGC